MKKKDIVKTTFFEYELITQIGEGGAGVVFKAERCFDRMLFAIKFLTKGHETGKFARFKNEFAYTLTNQHKNIIHAIDSGVFEDNYFYVMPFADNSLRSVIGEISPRDAYFLFTDILDGLCQLHSDKIIHRDLKPENILLFSGNAVIADLGIAHFEEPLAEPVETRPGERLANNKYAAPEQRERNCTFSPATDIFALGLILNEIFTSQLAVGKGYRKIADVAPEYEYLDKVVDNSIAFSPEKRFSSANELKEYISQSKYNISYMIHDLRSAATHFHIERICVPFPGLENKVITDKKIIMPRFLDLFRPPLILGGFYCTALTRGTEWGNISKFHISDDQQICYIDFFECDINKIFVHRDHRDYISFIYLELNQQSPISYSEEYIEEQKRNTSPPDVREEYYKYEERYLSSSEEDIGYFINSDGVREKIDSQQKRTCVRFLTPWNFMILSSQNPVFDQPYSSQVKNILDDILREESTIMDLVNFMKKLPKPDFYRRI
ncbi:MAG: serine/threonine-protein kinase [Victivallaceae bacterium]